MQESVLTMDTITSSIAALLVRKSVSISKTAGVKELFAFVMNRVVVVPQEVTAALSLHMLEVASLGFWEGGRAIISGSAVSGSI